MMYYRRTQGRIDGAKMVQFFRYNTKIGRKIVLKQEHKDMATLKFFIQEGISERTLAKFWKMIWHDSGDHKIMMCLWLIVHRALPIGAWTKGPNVDPRCGAFLIVYGNVMKQRLYGEGHYECYAMPLAHLPSNGDMLVGIVLMMIWINLITHAKQCTEGRMERFD